MTRILARVIGVTLWFAPADFRARFGQEIVSDLEHGLESAARKGGAAAMLNLWGRAIVDGMKVAMRERRVEAAAGGGPSSPWSDLGGDVKYALRGWKRSPGFSATVVLTLALGLGLASAIFAFADGYLFRPLPFPAADRAYSVRDPNAPIALGSSDTAILRESSLAHYGFVEWSAGRLHGELVVDDRRLPLWSFDVTRGFRQTLQLPLIAGRDFTDDDHREGAPVVVWLSHKFWKQTFRGDEAVIGRRLRLEGPAGARDIHVIGILGPQVSSFDLNNRPPDVVAPQQGTPRVGPNILSFPMVVLPEGVSPEEGAQRIAAILQAQAPAADGRPRTIRLRSLTSLQVAGGTPTAKVFLAGAALVLLLASLNLVHLLLSRSLARVSEVTTRAALGASRWRVARVFLVESLLFGVAGIGAGLLLGWSLSGWIASRLPEFPTSGRNLSLVPMLFDARAVTVAIVLGLIVAVVGGLWPARLALSGARAEGMRDGRAGRVPSNRLSRAVLLSELTVATMVIVGAVFIGMGIYRYLNQPLGFDYADRVRIAASGPDGRPLTGNSAVAALEAVRAVGGIQVAAFERPAQTARDISVPGVALDLKQNSAYSVTEGYFEAWGMRMHSGRWFEPGEFQAGNGVAVVDDRFAKLAWPDADPLTATIYAGGSPRRVIGVVAARRELLDRELPPSVYLPAPAAAGRTAIIGWAPGGSIDELQSRIASAVQAVVPASAVTVTAITFESLFLRGIGEAQFQAPIVIIFGILAVALAGIGVFGLVSYIVERRTREFGIRMALGAKLHDIWRTVMRESLQPTVIGLVLGSTGALALESVVQSSVFGWKSSGPMAIAIVAAGLLIVAVVAAIIPAGRAARVDPARTLRAE
jgi:putative ABC transport system permease protein